MTEPARFDALEHIRLDGGEFVRMLSESDPARTVASCPGWAVDDLAIHLIEVWNFWAEVVSREIDDRSGIRAVERPARPSERSALIDLAFETHVRLCDALHAADADTEVWTWTGSNQPVSWVARRMTHETMVHLWDLGRSQDVDLGFSSAVAADGIDEWLTHFAAFERRDGEMKVGGTVHLHCTDDDLAAGAGEWFVSAMKEPAAAFTREHRKADVAVRGEAQDILLMLWRRVSIMNDAALELIGDPVVARRFQAFTALD